MSFTDVNFDYVHGSEKKCAVCGFEYVRPLAVVPFCGSDAKGGALHAGLVVREYLAAELVGIVGEPNRNRGLSFAVEYECESGHRYTEYTLFHKGMTFMHWTKKPLLLTEIANDH